jgi:hypothetical protein
MFYILIFILAEIQASRVRPANVVDTIESMACSEKTDEIGSHSG